MDKTYDPKILEASCYSHWEEEEYFKPQGTGKPYCIMLPPPNVTGSLHMGHGFQHTLIDAMIRYQRMMGKRVLWQPGTDHAGISTQLVVERQLLDKGIKRADLTRQDFVENVWSWKEKSGDIITQQMRRLGASCDWTRQRFTMDKGLSSAVQKVFIQLYDEGLIYRGNRLVNWDPVLGSAISDLEVHASEESGFLWHISYPLADSDTCITIATTRPETLLGDTALAVHPDDERYKDLIGREVLLPLCDRKIPIIADPYVDKEFGSGCVKITPGHDFNDFEVGKRHNLPIINILNKDAKLNENVPVPYQGLDRFAARKKIINDLTALNLLIKTEPHTLKIPRGEKTNEIIEPFITEQWYVKTESLASEAIAVVKKHEIEFIPENWSKTYFQWMENIEDWCISRQLWWGHRIPAWYDESGQIYVGLSEKDVRFKYNLDYTLKLTQDEDVLDTWFSSALWPFSSLGWPERTKDLEEFYPTNILYTGFDIIFFWVARMIMMGLKFTGKIPFEKVIITGLICDADGKKMSKSKGNVIDPLDVVDGIDLDSLIVKRTSNLVLKSARDKIAKDTAKTFPEGIRAYGADALRFTFCALASHTRVVRFELARVEGYRNFCNKLWNASRFVLMNTNDDDFDDNAFQYSLPDLWILSKLQEVKILCKQYFDTHRFDLLANTLYDFVWHEYCDWYLELSKPILYSSELAAKIRGTKKTLIHVLDQILKLLHPIIPFITEEIWQKIKKYDIDPSESIMLSSYPEPDHNLISKEPEEEIEFLKEVVQAIRTIRSEMSISPSREIPLLIKFMNPNKEALVNKLMPLLKTLCKLSHVKTLSLEEIVPAASALIGEVEWLIPMNDLIDKDAEVSRLNKEITKLSKDILLAETKLNNPKFIDKAPEEVILKERDKLAEANSKKKKLELHLEKIKSLGN